MPSPFDRLASIIGPMLTEKVMAEMGGQQVKIRKRMDVVLEEYLKDQQFYDTISIKEGAKRLRCSVITMKLMRSREKKTYFFPIDKGIF